MVSRFVVFLLVSACLVPLSAVAESAVSPAGLVQGIIGADDRKEANQLPAAVEKLADRVGLLISYLHDDKGSTKGVACSGAVIARRYILTAAHCAYDDQGELLENLFFYPGVSDGQMRYGKHRVTTVFMPENFSIDASFRDIGSGIAIMEVAPSREGYEPGDRVGHLGVWGRTLFPQGQVTTLGYPSDRLFAHQYAQLDCNAKQQGAESNALVMDCDLASGQFGGPILVYSEQYQTFHVQGVAYGVGDGVNQGVRISQERSRIFQYILRGEFDSEAYRQEGFAEQWKRVDIPEPEKVHVHIRNECPGSNIMAGFNYKTDKGEWRADGFMKIKPFQEQPLFESGNAVFYLTVFSEDGKAISRQDVVKRVPRQDVEVGFQKYQVDSFGNFTYHFGCP